MSNADMALLERWLKQGDPEAFKTVALRYAGMVYSTCRRVLRNHSDAEDVAQDCFVALASGRAKPTASLGPWLHRVATNRALKRLSSESHRKAREKAYAEQVLDATGRAAGWDDFCELVDEAIDRLPEQFRAPVVAHFLDNETHDAIAQRLSVSRQTVTYRINKGVELIRAALKRKGVEIAAVSLAAMLASNTSEAAPASLVAGVGKLALAGPKSGAASVLMTVAKVTAAVAGVVVVVGTVAVFGSWRLRLAAKDRALNAGAPQAAQSKISKALSTAGAALSLGGPQARETSAPTPNPGALNAKDFADEGVVTGRVYDAETGEGIDGVPVHAYPYKKTDAGDTKSETDADGCYRIEGLHNGKYSISLFRREVKKYPFLEMTMGIDVALKTGHGIQGVDFALNRGIEVSGRVTAADGTPVAGAQILSQIQYLKKPNWRAYAKSGADGAFSLHFPKAGEGLSIEAVVDEDIDDMARPPGSAPENHIARSEPYGPVALPEGGLRDVILTISNRYTASVSGRLVNSAGKPLGNYMIALHPSVSDRGVTSQYVLSQPDATTAEDGSFQIAGVAAGSYDVTVTSPMMDILKKRASVQDQKAAEITIAAGQALTGLVLSLETKAASLAIAGRTVDADGKAVAGVLVCVSSSRLNFNSIASSNKDGAFRIEGLSEGTYLVLVEDENHGHVKARASDVAAGTEDLVIVTPGFGAVDGRVIDARDGAAIEKFELYVAEGEVTEFDAQSFRKRRDVFDTEGKFSADTLNPGAYTIGVKAAGFTPVLRTVNVVEGKTIGGVELRMTPSANLNGKVVSATGAPVADARILLGELPAEPDLDADVATRTAADGTFTLRDIPASLSRISAYHARFGPVTVNIAQAGRIVLPPESVLQGRVTAGGAPLVRVQAQLETPKGPNIVVTDSDGIYRFTSLAAGTVTVSVESGDDRRLSQDASLAEGRTTTLNFDFGADNAVVEGQLALDGASPEGVRLDLRVDTDAGNATLRPKVEADGAYRVEHVPAGHARLSATLNEPGSGQSRRAAEFEVANSQVARQDFDFSSSRSVQGMIAGVGNGYAGAVLLAPANATVPSTLGEPFIKALVEQAAAIGECGADGKYRLGRLEPGEYTVYAICVPESARKDDVSRWRVATAAVKVESDVVTLDLRPR